MGKRHTLISFLLDRTGSMSAIWDATIDQFNEFLKGQLSQDYKTTWHVTVFDSQSIDVIRDGVKGKNMLPIAKDEVFPRAMTPLHDAIGKTILATDDLVGDFDGVIFVILTDGQENYSQEFTLDGVRALVRDREDREPDGWQFIFLGANMDAYATGQSFGIVRGQTIDLEATPDSVDRAYAVVAASTQTYAETGQTTNTHLDSKGGKTTDRDAEEVSS